MFNEKFDERQNFVEHLDFEELIRGLLHLVWTRDFPVLDPLFHLPGQTTTKVGATILDCRVKNGTKFSASNKKSDTTIWFHSKRQRIQSEHDRESGIV